MLAGRLSLTWADEAGVAKVSSHVKDLLSSTNFCRNFVLPIWIERYMDRNIEIARIQREISKALELTLDHVVFDYTQEDGLVQLNLITINPRHDETFLFHTTEGTDKLEALQQMIEYVEKKHAKKQSFTVQWAQKGKSELQVSYFRARTMYEVLDKFFHGRNAEEYIIFSIQLNPIA